MTESKLMAMMSDYINEHTMEAVRCRDEGNAADELRHKEWARYLIKSFKDSFGITIIDYRLSQKAI